jgi:hypothetical protein
MSALVKSAKAATNSFEVQLAKFLLAAKKEEY